MTSSASFYPMPRADAGHDTAPAPEVGPARPAARVAWRLFVLCAAVVGEGARFLGASVRLFILGRSSDGALLRDLLPRLCERCGGAFPKIGQLLSTRQDLLPGSLCAGLRRLQDDVEPIPEAALARRLGGLSPLAFRHFDRRPVASATIAQVHRARRADDGREVAVKVLRPGIRQELVADCEIASFVARQLARLPAMRGVPLARALTETSALLVGQTDFAREASNLERLGRLFSGSDRLLVPALHRDLCTPTLLCADYVEGMRRLDDPGVTGARAAEAVTVGVRALFQMVFVSGFIHCDMHPGNMLVAPDGRLVLLDAGFMAELDDATRRRFAEFFLAVAIGDGRTAARIVRETAHSLPSRLDVAAFDADVAALVKETAGLKTREFRVASFVGRLFAIQREHGLTGTSRFTLAILSMFVFEGVAKARAPGLDFQRESVPFVMAALA